MTLRKTVPGAKSAKPRPRRTPEPEPVDVLDWLGDPVEPALRRLVLTDLLDRPAGAPEVKAAAAAMYATGPLAALLAGQEPDGHWGVAEDFYAKCKYSGTVWSTILLAELGADGRDPRVRAAAEFLLRWSQEREGGGFAYRGSAANGGQPSGVIPCLTGNLAWCLERFGLGEDPRARRAVEWIARNQRLDDGDGPGRHEPNMRDQCFGRHVCHMGVVKGVKALAEIPPGRRTPEVRRFLADATEYLLRHRIYKRSHDPSRPGKPFWTKLGHPRMWRFDALETLDLLAGLGVRDPRLDDAVELVRSKRGPDGRWVLESSFEGRTAVPCGRLGRPSKWVTFHALRALKRLGLPV